MAHYADHNMDPDPDCAQCREEWDYYGEAQAMYEAEITKNRCLLMPTIKHIVAAFAKIEELENALANKAA